MFYRVLCTTKLYILQSSLFVRVKTITEEPNLKEIEKKAYMAYHQDGLLDIIIGVYALAFGLGIFMDAFWGFSGGISILPGILIAVILPIWIAAKRKITMPRIGFVKFGSKGANKLMAVLLGVSVAGLGVFFAFTLLQGHSPLMELILQNGLLIVGIGSFAVCSLFGYTMGLKRLYAYGLLCLTLFVIGHVAGIFFAYLLVALGITVIATGSALLISFVRKYPLQG